MNHFKFKTVIFSMLLGAIQNAPAQWTYSSPTATGNCAAIPAALTTDFTVTPLISRALFPAVNQLRVNKMAFWMNTTTQKMDLYLAEKGGGGVAGRVLYYNGSAVPPTLAVIGTIPNVYIGFQEDGVVGIALDQQTFTQNNYLYFKYNVGNGPDGSASIGWRISRFTVNATTKIIDLASEKILLHIPAGTSNRWHQGGAMSFDNFGNLYITQGDNEAEANGPANTADLRGGIIRIHPDNSARGYSIPAGNFGEYWAAEWTRLGLTARAAAYRDTSIVKAELYVKGSRNPYGMSTDKYRLGWIAWSECGPDAQRNEEYNLTNHPAFSGWPFWAGNSVKQLAFAGSYNEPNEPNTAALWNVFNYAAMTTAVPVNNWAPAAGYDTLPPMHPPTHYETNGCAQGGAIVRYDGRLTNPEKLPPHLNNSVFYTNETSNNYYAVKYDSTTAANVGAVATVFTGLPRNNGNASLGNSVDLQQGPDGSLYSLNWGEGCCNGDRGPSANEGVARVEYTGTCKDPGLFPGSAVPVLGSISRGDAHWLRVGGKSFSVMSVGPHEARILDMQGRTIRSVKGQGWKDYDFPSNLTKNNVYTLQAKTEQGSAVRAFVFE